MTESSRFIGRYRLLRTIARGGMGELYAAELQDESGWTKQVALKTVLPHLEDDPDFTDRFLDEARIAGALSHANIVPVFDAGRADEGWYLAMELVDGPDLRRVLKALRARDERMPEAVALFVAAELCAALAFAHAARGADGRPLGIVHRDVTPANVLLSRSGDVKLTDFGIAAARDRLVRTRTGQLRGTFHYMSPEQAAGQSLDARSDVFSVGSLLFEMLSGRRAFDGDSEMEVLAAVQRGERPDFAALEPDRAPPLVLLVERALERDPERRYASAAALREDLLEILGASHGLVTRDDVAAWLRAAFPDDAGLGAGASGPSLDDILNAQLDAGPRTPTTPPTGSRSGTRSRPGGVAPPPSGTVTRYEPATPVPAAASASTELAVAPAATPRWRLPALVAALGVAALAAWWFSRPGHGELAVRSFPDGAEVFVDGRPVGVTALTTELEPGTYELRIARDGHEPWSSQITISRGELLVVSEELVPADRDVEFHSVPPGAVVRVDGGAAFPAGNEARVPVGREVELRMELDGYEPLVEAIVFAPETNIVTRTLTPLPGEPEPEDGSAEPGEAERPEPPTPRPTTMRSWRLSGVPDGARVTVDGAPLAGNVVRLPAGGAPVTVRVEADGFAPWEQQLDPRRSAGGRVAVALEAAGDPGTLLVRFGAEPMVGEIFIDGASRGRTTDLQQAYSLTPGRYAIEIRNDALGLRDQASVAIDAGGTVTFLVDWLDG